ncbi:MAG: cytochrome d ubiquinol oxidase subunit II [Thiofilum sp.]|uniref:cytochrome d ubiquinol oxidase subunit II n=1 Tax=Thiofilum sp. TaxID=2212733 RepID=UPI0025E3F8CB|nr:cytochrome d ubiquinol oxidase subunit II [Thiofilum sp.]MBK8455119.1 cytochrome d ubiquinol oxidase subunit II [Thiofilum sp.]
MIFDYETFKVIWWVLVGVLFIGFALTDGFDMGVGALLRYVGYTDDERRVAINTIAPHWDGNQVWLILAAGAIFAAWPITFGVSFSFFYLAMVLTLFALFFRPVGFDYRSKIEDTRWRNLWDWGLVIAGVVPPFVFGVAFGNLLLGVPFEFDEFMRSSNHGSFFGLFHPFAIIAGLLSLAMFTLHGATYLMLRTEGGVYERSRYAAQYLALAVFALFALAGIWVWLGMDGYVITQMPPTDALPNPLNKTVAVGTSAWLTNYQTYPWALLAPVAGLLGALGAYYFTSKHYVVLAFLNSALTLIGVIVTAGISLFPFIMPSSLNPSHSLTIWDSASSHLTLAIMFWSAMIFVPLIIIYTLWCYRALWGKITVAFIRKNDHSVY